MSERQRHRAHHSKIPGKSKFDFGLLLAYNRSMHKIAFAGIAGSGKTSVLAEVKKLLSLKYRIDEVPDLRPGNPFDYDQRTAFVSTFYFVTSQINEENIRAQGRPDFLLCDGSLLDHWLEWRLSSAGTAGNGKVAERNALLEELVRFGMPAYAAIFRIRADAKTLQERAAPGGMREFNPDLARQADELYGQIIRQERLPAFDIWNQQSVDESAQEAMMRLADMKLI